jgi:FSR family fosmidomycin resistance protein-like MFS transporter
MTSDSPRTDWNVIIAITLVHFAGDFFSSFTSPLFPVFLQRLDLTLAQVGIIAGINRFLAFVVQPTVGYLADRTQSRVYILGGVLLTVVCIPLSGLAGSFWTLLACIAAGSVGSSMFHPSAAGMVPVYAGRRAGLAMSIFNTGGTLAFGVGPVLVTAWVARWGLEGLPWAMLPGLALLGYLYFTVPPPTSEGLRQLGFWGALRESLGTVWSAVVLIWVIQVLRAVVGQSFLTFMPLLFVGQGYSLTTAGALFSLFTVAGTFSGVLAGHLSDRFGFKPVFYGVYGLMTPLLIGLLHLRGAWVFLGTALAGACVLATLPLGVVMAQTLAPRGRSMAASLMMGLSVGLGGLVSPLVGLLADRWGVTNALHVVALLPLVTLALIRFMPEIGAGCRRAGVGAPAGPRPAGRPP